MTFIVELIQKTSLTQRLLIGGYFIGSLVSCANSTYVEGKKALLSYRDTNTSGGDVSEYDYIRNRVSVMSNMFYGLVWPYSITSDIVPHLIISANPPTPTTSDE